MQKILALIMMLAAMLAVGCGDTSVYDANGHVHLRMAQASAADGAIGKTMEAFAQDVKEKSNPQPDQLQACRGRRWRCGGAADPRDGEQDSSGALEVAWC